MSTTDYVAYENTTNDVDMRPYSSSSLAAILDLVGHRRTSCGPVVNLFNPDLSAGWWTERAASAGRESS